MAELLPLLKLKPGETSKLITLKQGKALFKFVKPVSELPKDYDKKKAKYAKEYKQSLAEKALEDKLKVYRKKKDLVKWMSKGYQTLYNYSIALAEPENASKEKRNKLFNEYYEKAKKVENDPIGSKVAVMLQYTTVESLWRDANDAQKKKLREKRIAAITNLLQGEKIEHTNLRVELIKMFIEAKDANAGEALLHAAEYNTSFDPMSQFAHSNLKELLEKAKKAKLISAEQIKKTEAELKRWSDEKAEHDAYQAKQRKEAEEAKKREEEAIKKEKAAIEKMKKEEAKKKSDSAKKGTSKKTGEAQKKKEAKKN